MRIIGNSMAENIGYFRLDGPTWR